MTLLDDKDQSLIASLRKNARASLVSLAKDINLSRSATHERIVRLEANGTIRGYTVVLNETILPVTKAVFTLSIAAGIKNPLLAKKISELPDVTHTQCLSGEIDILIHAVCVSTVQIGELRAKISNLEGVMEIKTHIVLAENGI